jgi:uncharacterized protein (DUF302 family)
MLFSWGCEVMNKPDVFDYTVSTGKDVENCIVDVTAALKEEGFGVLGILDFQAVLKQKGVELGRDYRLLECAILKRLI